MSFSKNVAISKIIKPARPFPAVDWLIAGYAGITILFQILFQISPVVSFLVHTPLYKMQTYLGVLGAALILLDLFTTKRIWSGKYSFFLYCILILAGISSVRMLSYGIKENLFKLCWMSIQFILIYTLPQRMDRATLKKFVKIVFFTILSIWFICCCISLYQYVNQISYSYVVNPLAMDSSANRQGFHGNRLFGIFYTLNTAATVSLLLFIAGLFFIIRTKKLILRLALLLAELVLFCHIILSYSRSTILCLLLSSVIFTWFSVRNKLRLPQKKNILLPIAAAILGLALCFGIFYGIRNGLTYLPYLREKLQISLQKEPDTDPSHQQDQALQNDGHVRPDGTANSGNSEPEYDKHILDRHLRDNMSNGRLSIWRDYVSLYKEIGPIGLSPGNYMPYVMEHHPELFIVEDIRESYPDKFESGIIYHGHSGYLIVFIATGFLGLFALLAFIGCCLFRVIKTVFRNKKVSRTFICAFLYVAICAVTAALDEGLFFQNSPQTTLFYFALGILMNTSFYEKSSQDVQ